MPDSRHRQLSRIYQRPIEDDEDARTAIMAEPGVLASALFLEAVESDDVTSIESAREYFQERLTALEGLIGPAAAAVGSAFAARLSAWE